MFARADSDRPGRGGVLPLASGMTPTFFASSTRRDSKNLTWPLCRLLAAEVTRTAVVHQSTFASWFFIRVATSSLSPI
ncbi:hypothetical protein D3C85_634980 [compost metagenome]